MRNETDSIPDTFLDVLTPASRVHNHNIRFVSNLNYFRPRVSTNLGKTSFKFSAPKVWETVAPGLKCLPYHKFKKEWKSLSSNQPNLTLLICSITDIIWDFISSLYCCRLSEHDGVQQESSCNFGHCTQMNLMSFSWLLFISYFIFPTYACVNILCSVK